VPPVRVFHGDDYEPYRYLVRELLPDDELHVVGSAGDPEEIVEGVLRSSPTSSCSTRSAAPRSSTASARRRRACG
jgi:hypothetical protein